MLTRMKKTCPKCGQKKWLRDFYVDRYSPDGRTCMCSECMRVLKRDEYHRNRKVPDGIKFDKTGRKVMHNGYSSKIYWDGNMLSILKKHFHNTLNEELAEMLGVSPRTMIRKARELGLKKDEQWLKNVWKEHALLAKVASAKNGNRGWLKPGHKFWGNQYTGKLSE